MIKLTTLFSGSKGNCTLVQTENTNILVDLGLGFNNVKQSLQEVGLSPKDVHEVLITHEHNDHISALPVWSKYLRTPVRTHELLADCISEKTFCTDIRPFTQSFEARDLQVDFYTCSHDSRFCCGYRFFDGKNYVAIVTDNGKVTEELKQFLLPCRTVMLESNHDVDMLTKGDYPYQLKRRILSDRGHLSNAQAAEVIGAIAAQNTVNIVLAHLSENNNTHELAFASAVNACSAKGVVEGKDVRIYVADRFKRGVTIE